MLVITDGRSNYPTPGVQPGPTDAKKNNITTLAWGIGQDINMKELIEIANGISDKVEYVTSYSHLFENRYKYKKVSCSLAQTPPMNTKFEDRLFQHE
jgi:hypothetical protein